MIRVVLPAPLRVLVGAPAELSVLVEAPVTQRRVLDAVEFAYPALTGTMRDRMTGRRRPFVRFFACQEDLSNESPDAALPDAVAFGAEPFVVLGAIAGG